MSKDNIKAFIHCRTCRTCVKGRLAIGLIDQQTVRIWCERCDKLVVDFPLAIPVPLRCDHCGEPIGPDHTH